MGWASAAGLFDQIMDCLAEFLTTRKLKIVASQIADVLEQQDWDTQYDSAWYAYLFVDEDGNDLREE